VRIEELLIAGFGRFRGRRFALEPGLNVIYGPNEAGKTTLQTFLAAMFYGMQKRGQRRAYTDEVERYRPWAGGEYRGALIYRLDSGRRYRVERQFDPGHDRLAVYDAGTGLDLSGQFEQDRRKELLFAEAHLGLNEEAFRSTAWVGQLAVGRLDLGRELVARVANLQEAGREDLSVRSALAWLDEQAKAIGTERAAARPYGKVVKAIHETREALDRAQAVREQVRGWEGRLQETRAVLEELEAELAEAQRRLDWALLVEAEARLSRVAEGTGRIAELKAVAAELAGYAGFPAVDLPRLRRLVAEAEEAVGQAEALAEAAAGLGAADLRRARSAPVGAGNPLPTVAAVAAGLLLVGAAGAVALGYLLPGGALALLAAGALALWWMARSRAMQAAAEEEARTRALRSEQEAARRRAEAAAVRAQQSRDEVAAVLAAAGVADVAAFEAAVVKHDRWQRARDEAGALEAAVGAQLGDDLAARVEALRARVRGGRPAHLPASEALQAEVRRLEARRADLTARVSDLGARVETALDEVADTADLRRDLDALHEQKVAYDEELAAIQLAASTLETVAGEMHRDFAPRLNTAMGEVAAGLTGGRYRTVRVDEEGALRIITGDDRTVAVGSLSGGTADQLYLGLRVALLDLLTGGQESVPLFLDDPFVQYDDERAEAAMEFLRDLSRRRQVVLLTCHRREVALAAGAHLLDLAEA
jgi:DNA repair exonuclease SbcCD ATPase subunit